MVKSVKTEHRIEVCPSSWVMPYSSTFNKWVYSTFGKSYLNDVDGSDMFKHQRFVRDFMQKNSPYRGILLFHGLGVGKTRSAISICESQGRDVVVLLPKSLKTNFESELLKTGATQKYEFVHYNGFTKKNVSQLIDSNTFVNKTVVIDEIHNFITAVTNNSLLSRSVYQELLNSDSTKIIGLTGTPIINNPIETAMLCNLMAGYIRTTPVKINKGSVEVAITLANSHPRVAHCRLSPSDPKTIHVHHNPLNFMSAVTTQHIKYARTHNHTDQVDASVFKGLDVTVGATFKNTLLPFKETEFGDMFIGDDLDMKNKVLLQRRIQGLVSYFEFYDKKQYPEQIPMEGCTVADERHSIYCIC
jgi:hypothetical protein